MAEYTYKDVIIDPNDPRVEIGKEYWFADYPFNVLLFANRGAGACYGILSEINREDITPFLIRGQHNACIIRKKESEKKYVPFDLGDPEVRENLRGKWAVADGDEGQISGFHRFDGEEWMAAITTGYVTAEGLFDKWKFVDGSPCGVLMEEE